MTAPVLVVYYDASCPLCRAEIAALADADAGRALRFVDCSPPDFSIEGDSATSITRATLMQALHARDSDGRWYVGVDAFEAMYRVAGLENVARLWGHRRLKPLLVRLYPWVARNRQGLSRLGLTGLFERWVRREARKAVALRCDTGGCALPNRPAGETARNCSQV